MRHRVGSKKIAAFCMLVVPAFAATPANGPSSKYPIPGTASGAVFPPKTGHSNGNGTIFIPPSPTADQTNLIASNDGRRFMGTGTYDDMTDSGYQDSQSIDQAHGINASGSGDRSHDGTSNGASPFPSAFFGGIGSFAATNGQPGQESPGSSPLFGGLGQSNNNPASDSGNGSGADQPATNDATTNYEPPPTSDLADNDPPSNDPPDNDPPVNNDPPLKVPEPLTLSLFGFGLAGAIAVRQRKKSTSR